MSIARLKITLDDVKPQPVRRIEVPLGIKLSDLHLVIQAAMPWWNYHLYEFRVRDVGWGIPDPDLHLGDGPLDARKATLRDVIEDTGAKSLKYLYDFGDGWEHSVKIEKITEPEPDMGYPRLVEAKGRCPPEDVGGPWGYEEYLEAIADPNHERHQEMVQWRGKGFDPDTVDIDEIKRGIAALARKWARAPSKPARKKKQS